MTKLKKILHVEDEADILEITKMSLQTLAGFELLQCSNGEDAIASASEFDPDLVLLDVMMHGLSGEETLQKLRELDGFETKPYVFMTAKASQDSVVALKAHGVADVLTKPFDPVSLPQKLVDIWSDWNS